MPVGSHCEISQGRALLPGCSETSGHFHMYREKEREGHYPFTSVPFGIH